LALSCLLVMLIGVLSGCGDSVWNNPYPTSDSSSNILYSSFSERPKHLDPAVAYSSNEYALIAQVYEPVLQYHYLLRPYRLVPLSAEQHPEVIYRDSEGRAMEKESDEGLVAFTDYVIAIAPGIRYQPHPAFAKDEQGNFLYHALVPDALDGIHSIGDFPQTGSRELVAEDYIYQIKRLVDPDVHSPIAEFMKAYIVGLSGLSNRLEAARIPGKATDLNAFGLEGVKALDRYRYRIRIRGKYPQFRYWLAMPFFSPMPWEAVRFYRQKALQQRNITLDWFPVGTGPYMVVENNPNRRMVLQKNPNFHGEYYPSQGEISDRENGLLDDAGSRIPFIDRVVYSLEKENIPFWNKFMQGYYDASGISSDSFDQAVRFTIEGDVGLTADLRDKGISLKTSVLTSVFYMGFNMLDPVLGGGTENARKLRQAISIAVDYEEYISIFMNGRGIVAQGILPPGIYGRREGEQGINPFVYDWIEGAVRRKGLQEAKALMSEAGYPGGVERSTGKALILYFDTVATGPDDRARLNWFRKQFLKLGIHLVIRGTDYNRFQRKMRDGNNQVFLWGWNADYPDPENFFFLLYGPNGKVSAGGENAANYSNPEFDRLFERMRNMESTQERFSIIQQMQEIIRRDSPWLFGFHPKSFNLYHGWYRNMKPNLMANNQLKYLRIDVDRRARMRRLWNRARIWPLASMLIILFAFFCPAWLLYRRQQRAGAL